MEIFVKNVKGLKVPTQAHPNEDALYDLQANSKPIIVGDFIESATFSSGGKDASLEATKVCASGVDVEVVTPAS